MFPEIVRQIGDIGKGMPDIVLNFPARRGRIVRLQGADDARPCLRSARQADELWIEEVHVGAGLQPQPLDEAQQGRLVGNSIERKMELADLQAIRDAVTGAACRGDFKRDPAQSSDLLLARPFGGLFGRQPLERDPDVAQFEDPGPRHEGDADRPAGLHFEGAFGHQPAQRLAHRRKADAQRAGDETEGQFLPGDEPACGESLAQRIVDLPAQGRIFGGAQERHCRGP